MGLPPELEFRAKGRLALELCADAAADGTAPDFYCGDEVYEPVKWLAQAHIRW